MRVVGEPKQNSQDAGSECLDCVLGIICEQVLVVERDFPFSIEKARASSFEMLDPLTFASFFCFSYSKHRKFVAVFHEFFCF